MYYKRQSTDAGSRPGLRAGAGKGKGDTMQELAEQKQLQRPHRLVLESRSRLSITGILEVESFDPSIICLVSTRGPLTIHGQGLHLQKLAVDGGEVLVDGSVDSILYEEEAPAGGFFARLFG